MAEIGGMYPWGCIPATIFLVVLALVSFTISVFRNNDKERDRVERYNQLIAANNDLIEDRITQEEYNALRNDFYSRHPNGDISY